MLGLPPTVAEALDTARSRREPNLGWQYLAGVVVFLMATAAAAVGPEALLHPWPRMAVGLLTEAVIGGAGFVILIRWLGQRPVLEFGRQRWVSELGTGLLLGIGLISLAVGAVALLGGYQVHGFQLGTGFLVGLAVGVGAGVAEEAFFRGVLLRLLDKQFGSWAALGITSLIFGGSHLNNGGAGAIGALSLVIEAGLLLGAAYLITRRLWFAVGVHIGWNFAESSLFSINVSGTGLGSGGLITSTMQGPAWLTGGSMGIEGSVVTIVIGLVAGVLLLVVAYRRGHILPGIGKNAPIIELRDSQSSGPPAL